MATGALIPRAVIPRVVIPQALIPQALIPQALIPQALVAQAVVLGAVLLAPIAAQGGFDQLFAEAEALPVADVTARRVAFAAAYAAFSRLPSDGAPYRRWLGDGARSALYADQPAAAAALFAELHRTRPVDGPSLRWQLIAMVRSGRGRAAVALAKRHRDAAIVGVSEAVLDWARGGIEWLPRASDFGRLAALGGELLQDGDEQGLWLLLTQDAAMRDRPGREFSLSNLGLAYRQLGRVEASEQAYRAALDLAPGTEWLWNDYGLLLKGMGRLDEAVRMFVSGMKQEANPGAGSAGTNLGVLFQRTGEKRGRDPQADLLNVVRSRPDADMARRLLLDGLSKRR